jgi:hypothetical protein
MSSRRCVAASLARSSWRRLAAGSAGTSRRAAEPVDRDEDQEPPNGNRGYGIQGRTTPLPHWGQGSARELLMPTDVRSRKLELTRGDTLQVRR